MEKYASDTLRETSEQAKTLMGFAEPSTSSSSSSQQKGVY